MSPRPHGVGAVGDRTRENIRFVRTLRRYTLEDLSDRLTLFDRPLSEQVIGDIERGRRRIDVDDLVAIAEALGVSPSALLGTNSVLDVFRDAVDYGMVEGARRIRKNGVRS
ncbi:helix-turn-helix domain-containing protein [Rhodococcus sp. PD04]|uniref:helix-turn-helix domain-containing protein n=1 Tax=Rhodococcus sp. PD04 TaxID=3109594 RepID=UPI002DD93847|nr:helix-turn-helix transcriptional regulator [Rhodococcus sp. PD04]WSE22353.1 helix-turn-helix transcriptional regulator [Rhodococcus sp. PD04]